MIWNKKLARIAADIVSKHLDPQTAHVAARKAVGADFSFESLDRAMRQHAGATVRALLRQPDAAIATPIERKAAERKKDADKKALDEMVAELEDRRARQAFLDAMTHGYHEPPKVPFREKASGLREMTAVCLASDWHVEETVLPEHVAGLNEYNMKISDQRITRFFEAIVRNVERERAEGTILIRDLILALMGDLITGYIHEELMQANGLSPIETVLWLMPRLRRGILMLLERLQLESITIPCSHGNHGRTTKKSMIARGAENSYEWLLYNQLAMLFEGDSRVKFEITKSAHQYVQPYDFTLHFHHGDSLKFMGGIGGLSIPLLKAVPAWNSMKFSHYHHIGHFHTIGIAGTSAITNGSLIGYGAYSAWIRAQFEPPQQVFYLLDSKRGRCIDAPLWVGESTQPAKKVAA